MPVNEPAGERDHYLGGGCAPCPLLSQSPRLLGADPINIAPARLSRARFGLFSRITSTGSCPCMKAATEVPTDRFGGKWKKRSSNSSSVVTQTWGSRCLSVAPVKSVWRSHFHVRLGFARAASPGRQRRPRFICLSACPRSPIAT